MLIYRVMFDIQSWYSKKLNIASSIIRLFCIDIIPEVATALKDGMLPESLLRRLLGAGKTTMMSCILETR